VASCLGHHSVCWPATSEVSCTADWALNFFFFFFFLVTLWILLHLEYPTYWLVYLAREDTPKMIYIILPSFMAHWFNGIIWSFWANRLSLMVYTVLPSLMSWSNSLVWVSWVGGLLFSKYTAQSCRVQTVVSEVVWLNPWGNINHFQLVHDLWFVSASEDSMCKDLTSTSCEGWRQYQRMVPTTTAREKATTPRMIAMTMDFILSGPDTMFSMWKGLRSDGHL